MIVNRVSSLLDELGVSAYEFARRCGIREATVYDLKNDPYRFPGKVTIDRIVSTYGVRIEDVIHWIPDK